MAVITSDQEIDDLVFDAIQQVNMLMTHRPNSQEIVDWLKGKVTLAEVDASTDRLFGSSRITVGHGDRYWARS